MSILHCMFSQLCHARRHAGHVCITLTQLRIRVVVVYGKYTVILCTFCTSMDELSVLELATTSLSEV